MIIFKFSIYKICKTNQSHAYPYSKAFIQLKIFMDFKECIAYELLICLKNTRKVSNLLFRIDNNGLIGNVKII